MIDIKNRDQLADVLSTTKPILKGVGINIGKYNICVSKEVCFVTARILPDNIYGAEQTNGIAKSDYYEGLVDFMLWKYEQLEQISKK